MPDPVFISPAGSPAEHRSRGEALAIALVLTIAASAIPSWAVFTNLWGTHLAHRVPWGPMRSVVLLVMALILVLPTRGRSGLCVGRIAPHWKRVLLVCGLPVLATALLYPRLPGQPYSGYFTMWLISPLAQEMIFTGYIYGYLQPVFPDFVHPRLPVRRALVITVLLFGLYHSPGLLGPTPEYAWLQLFYTGVLGVLPALSRQWTGSILYLVLYHSAVNFVVWAYS